MLPLCQAVSAAPADFPHVTRLYLANRPTRATRPTQALSIVFRAVGGDDVDATAVVDAGEQIASMDVVVHAHFLGIPHPRQASVGRSPLRCNPHTRHRVNVTTGQPCVSANHARRETSSFSGVGTSRHAIQARPSSTSKAVGGPESEITGRANRAGRNSVFHERVVVGREGRFVAVSDPVKERVVGFACAFGIPFRSSPER